MVPVFESEKRAKIMEHGLLSSVPHKTPLSVQHTADNSPIRSKRVMFSIGLLLAALIFLIIHAESWLFVRAISIDSVQSLPAGSSFEVFGGVTFVDTPGKRFWIQDQTGALVVPKNPAEANIRVGDRIRLRAQKSDRYDSAEGPASLNLSEIAISKVLGRLELPLPEQMTLLNLPGPQKNGVRIQVQAVVRGVGTDPSGRLALWIGDVDRESLVVVATSIKGSERLVNAAVRFIGLPEQLRNRRGGILSQTFWVASERDLQILAPAPTHIPVYSVRDIYRQTRPGDGHLIRIKGTVSSISQHSVLLEDAWGVVKCNFSDPPRFTVGSHLEVEGFIVKSHLRFDLSHARAVESDRPESQPPSASSPNIQPLTKIADIRSLKTSMAAEALPVRVSGVITYNDTLWQHMFIMDGTGGIFVSYSGARPELSFGRRVEVIGVTGAGDFAPVVLAPKLRVLGKGPIPRPRAVSSESANAGSLDSQYVSLEGIVHPLSFAEEPSHPVLSFELYTSFGQVYVSASPGFSQTEEMQQLEDARVRISGVFATVFNARRQLIGYQLNVSSPSQIQVLEHSPSDPFRMPVTRIGSLLSFAPGSRSGRRVKVEGSVTLAGPNLLYVQDATGGVEVHAVNSSTRVGQIVEAVGYPSLQGRYSPILTDAQIQVLPRDALIAPASTSPDRLLRGSYDSQLVKVEGKLIAFLRGPAADTLVLQSGIHTFSAQLETTDRGLLSDGIREGSVLGLTGIASAQIDSAHLYRVLRSDPVSFRILLRSPEDVVIVQGAPFWTSKKLLLLLSALVLLTLVILTWVAVLRRRVRSQGVALERAAHTAQAVQDLSTAMERISAEENFENEVSVRGSAEIAQLVVGFNRMLSQLRQRDRAKRDAEEKLQLQALFDELTGLPNRRLLADRLSQSLAAARREKFGLGLLYIDLDGFKLVNDSFGHGIGDLLLREVARRLKARIREADTLARLGGDEFTAVVNHIKSKENAKKLAEDLLESLRAPFSIDDREISIGASIGIAIFPNAETENDDLLQQADCAMYAAKRDGKNRIVFFSEEIGLTMKKRFTIENELRKALAQNQISVFYQPEFNLKTNTIVCFEALARWKHPQLGFIPPLQFIPVAEETGLILPLGAWILEQACLEALKWRKLSDHPIQVAVNVSTQQFARSTFVDEIQEILEKTGLPPTLLQLELTESATLHGIQHASETIKRLHNLGVSVAMDDFGTGYSCLSYLPKLSFNALKIDRSFVSELEDNPDSSALVHSIVGLAQNLKMRVIVEGIENDAQLARVKELGGDQGQGYLLGRPTPNPCGLLQPPCHMRDLEAVVSVAR